MVFYFVILDLSLLCGSGVSLFYKFTFLNKQQKTLLLIIIKVVLNRNNEENKIHTNASVVISFVGEADTAVREASDFGVSHMIRLSKSSLDTATVSSLPSSRISSIIVLSLSAPCGICQTISLKK